MRCAHVAVATAVLGLAACSQESPSLSQRISNLAPTSSVTETGSSTTNLSDFERSAGRTPVPVVVEGSAFGLDESALEQHVANSMKGAYWGPRANFVPAYQARTMPQEPEYLVVMRLSPTSVATPAQQVTGAQLCASQYRVGSAGGTNATVAPSPPRGSTNPAMRNDAASTTRQSPVTASDEERYRNYNLSDASSSRSEAAAAVGRQEQVNSAGASTSLGRGSTNPAMRNDAAATEDRPAPIGPEDNLRKMEAGNMAGASSGTSVGTARGGTSVGAVPSRRGATASSARSNLHIVSALCHYNQAVRAVDTRAMNVSGPNDPAFNNLIVSTTNQLTQPVPIPNEPPAEPGQER